MNVIVNNCRLSVEWSERSACAARVALQTGCVANEVASINTVILVRAKCVRQRLVLHTLVENVVASINTIIFSPSSLSFPYFSPTRG
jgi:hypothetical protein